MKMSSFVILENDHRDPCTPTRIASTSPDSSPPLHHFFARPDQSNDDVRPASLNWPARGARMEKEAQTRHDWAAGRWSISGALLNVRVDAGPARGLEEKQPAVSISPAWASLICGSGQQQWVLIVKTVSDSPAVVATEGEWWSFGSIDSAANFPLKTRDAPSRSLLTTSTSPAHAHFVASSLHST